MTLQEYKQALQQTEQQLQQLATQQQRLIGAIAALQELEKEQDDTNDESPTS